MARRGRKTRVGRPPLPAAERLVSRHVRAAEPEWRAWRDEADHVGMSRSAWLRHTANRAVEAGREARAVAKGGAR